MARVPWVDISLACLSALIAGTYSSIFIASPLLVTFQELSAKTREAQRGRRPGTSGPPRRPTRRAPPASVKVAPIKPGKRLGSESTPQEEESSMIR